MPTRRFSGPLVPGTKSVRQVNRRPTRRVTVKPATLTKMIKNVTLTQVETKRRGIFQEGKNLVHNRTLYFAGIMKTAQGLGNPSGAMPDITNPDLSIGDRVGNEIIAKGLSIKMQLDNLVTTPIHYKVIVFEYATRLVTNDPAGLGAVNDKLLWQGKDGQGNLNMLRTIDSIATNRVRVVKEYRFTQIQGAANQNVKSFYIPLKNKKIKYIDNNSIDPQNKDLCVAVVCCGAMQTNADEHIADLNYAIKFTYKDP